MDSQRVSEVMSTLSSILSSSLSVGLAGVVGAGGILLLVTVLSRLL